MPVSENAPIIWAVAARYAVRHARGSGQRLFDLVFLVGTLVTVFLSNDATVEHRVPGSGETHSDKFLSLNPTCA